MSFFLLTFFLIYGSFHLYIFLKLRKAFNLPPRTAGFFLLTMLLLIGAPVFVRLAERANLEVLALILSYSGYSWMGFLVIFVPCILLIDLINLVGGAARRLCRLTEDTPFIPQRSALVIPLLLAMTIYIYGYFEARDITLKAIRLKSARIPAAIDGLKIVQISDVHLGLLVRRQRLKDIIRVINEAKPDILVATGDLVDGQINGLEGLAEMLQRVEPPYGKFAVPGNHEFYAGIDQTSAFTEKAGFTMLRNQEATVAGGLNIAGIDDQTGAYFGRKPVRSEQQLLSSLDRNNFTLLLKHRPVVEQASRELMDLQLSGHTHKGQIFPFNLVTYLFFPVQAGLNRVSPAWLYVSRGTGTWGPPIRFLSPPEVTMIELVKTAP